MRSGPVTARITRSAPNTVDCEAWGSGASRIHRHAAHASRRRRRRVRVRVPTNRRSPSCTGGCRICGWAAPIACWSRCIPAVLEQRVYGMDARRAWRKLVTKFGAPAPGPRTGPHAGAAARRRVAAHPVVGVSPRQRRPRPRTHDRRLRAARRLAGAAVQHVRAEAARTALTSLPGVGEWTAAETAQRAFGDADALSVGDFHLAKMVGWQPARPRNRRRRDGGVARTAAAASPPCGSAPRGQLGRRECRASRRRAGDPESARDLADTRDYRSCRVGTRRGKSIMRRSY